MMRRVRHLFTSLAFVASLYCSVFASAQTIYVSGGAPTLGPQAGILGTINPTTGVITTIGTTSVELAGLAFSPLGILYGVSLNAQQVYIVNPATGGLTPLATTTGITSQAPTGISLAAGLAFRPDGTLFLADATGAPGPASNLYTVNPVTGAATLVGPIGDASEGAIVFASNNLLQSNNDPANGTGGVDVLETLNQGTGAGTPLPTDTNFADIFGLAFSGGTLYGFTAGGDVISLNTSTGSGTPVLDGSNNPVFYSGLTGNQIILAATSGTPAAVPEPGTLALLAGISTVGAAFLRRRKQASKAA